MNPQHQQALYQFADQNGVPRNIAFALIRQESGGNPNARSPVGALGYTQLMPGTARGLGVNPNDPIQNLKGGMIYLGHLIKEFRSIPLALAAYNAGPGAVHKYGGIPPYKETQDYVKRIMGMAGPSGQASRPPTAARLLAQTSPLGTQVPAKPSLSDALNMAAPSQTTQGILGRLGDTSSSVAEHAEAPIPLPASATPAAPGLPMPPSQAGLGAPQQGGAGRIVVAPGANRPGVTLHGDILGFARQVAGAYGRPLTITTGTNHNEFVAGTHRESAHWTGEAADIAMKGRALTALGQAALIAAGADPGWAHKQKGGLFNIGGYQVIFNSMEGGNHFNHLHIGIRGHG